MVSSVVASRSKRFVLEPGALGRDENGPALRLVDAPELKSLDDLAHYRGRRMEQQRPEGHPKSDS